MKIINLYPAFIVCLLWLLNACSIGSTPIPADHYYRLPAPRVEPLSQRLFDRILIRPVQVEGLYHERAILYVEQDRPLEIHRYRYHFWVQPPASLLASHMQSWLRQSALADHISTTPSAVPAQLEITARINEFYRLVSPRGIDNRLAIEFSLRYPAAPDKAWSREYRVSLASASTDMQDTARAFGEALDRTMAMLLKDLLEKDS